MDRREKIKDPVTSMRVAFQGLMSEVWTALPVKLVEYFPETQSCSLQPMIQGGIRNLETKEIEWVDMPVLLDCPVVFPGGGGYLLTFPLKEGDEGLVILASRCIDGWWLSGEISPQSELRMHDLSDGFFLPGAASVPNVPADLSLTDVQLRAKEGVDAVSIGPLGVTITSALSIALVAPLVTVNGVPIP